MGRTNTPREIHFYRPDSLYFQLSYEAECKISAMPYKAPKAEPEQSDLQKTVNKTPKPFISLEHYLYAQRLLLWQTLEDFPLTDAAKETSKPGTSREVEAFESMRIRGYNNICKAKTIADARKLLTEAKLTSHELEACKTHEAAVVQAGVDLKFDQHPELRRLLEVAKGCTLVAAEPKTQEPDPRTSKKSGAAGAANGDANADKTGASNGPSAGKKRKPDKGKDKEGADGANDGSPANAVDDALVRALVAIATTPATTVTTSKTTTTTTTNADDNQPNQSSAPNTVVVPQAFYNAIPPTATVELLNTDSGNTMITGFGHLPQDSWHTWTTGNSHGIEQALDAGFHSAELRLIAKFAPSGQGEQTARRIAQAQTNWQLLHARTDRDSLLAFGAPEKGRLVLYDDKKSVEPGTPYVPPAVSASADAPTTATTTTSTTSSRSAAAAAAAAAATAASSSSSNSAYSSGTTLFTVDTEDTLAPIPISATAKQQAMFCVAIFPEKNAFAAGHGEGFDSVENDIAIRTNYLAVMNSVKIEVGLKVKTDTANALFGYVNIFRGPAEDGYPLLAPFTPASGRKQHCKIALIVTPASVPPNGIANAEYYELTKQKIRHCLRIAIENKRNRIVLGKIGKVSAEPLALCYYEVLHEAEFKDKFKQIVFRLPGADEDDTFVQVFNMVFGTDDEKTAFLGVFHKSLRERRETALEELETLGNQYAGYCAAIKKKPADSNDDDDDDVIDTAKALRAVAAARARVESAREGGGGDLISAQSLLGIAERAHTAATAKKPQYNLTLNRKMLPKPELWAAKQAFCEELRATCLTDPSLSITDAIQATRQKPAYTKVFNGKQVYGDTVKRHCEAVMRDMLTNQRRDFTVMVRAQLDVMSAAQNQL